MSVSSRLATAALCLALSFPALAITKGQETYLEGMRAYNSGDFAQAASKIAAALREDPAEGLRKFKGASSLAPEDYLPHYYLGLSLEQLGKKSEALAELRESERQGVIKSKASSYLVLQNAARRLEPPKPTPAPAPTATPAPARPTEPPPAPTRAAGPTSVIAAAPTPSARPTKTPRAAPTAGSSTTSAAPGDSSHAAVLEAIRSFYKGDYTAAAKQCDAYAPTSPTARLYLAYSLVARDLLGERRNDVTLARARDEYERAKKEGAKEEDPFVSPAIRQLLKTDRP